MSTGHKSCKVRSGDVLKIELNGQVVLIRLGHARRGEARLMVSADKSISVTQTKGTRQ